LSTRLRHSDHDTPAPLPDGAMTPAPSGVGTGPDQRVRSRGAPVRLERLTKRYDDVVAVDDISLDIAAGEFVSLLGPSGSGKTTTLMMVAGFQDVTAGAITVGDREISRLPPHQRDIGVVFQHYALFPHMRVAENIGFPLRMRDVSKAESRRRVEEAMRLVQLETYGDRYPRQLSGGQQQRVALARAVVFEPGLALMDEPLGALDRQLREQMQFEIKRLQNALGITVIYVTHDQEEALVMSDRIAVMNRGRVEQYATPDELYNRPATAFVATFVGESNAIAGRVTASHDGVVAMDSDEGHRLDGRSVEHLDAGAPVVAMIRPEKIVAVDAAGVPGDGANAVPVTVEEVTFIGQMSRYVVATDRGRRFVLRIQNRPGSVPFAFGQRLALTWAAEDLRVFPAGQDTATSP
jgi:putative spermidine/putrescine transport system ATP-binding protein